MKLQIMILSAILMVAGPAFAKPTKAVGQTTFKLEVIEPSAQTLELRKEIEVLNQQIKELDQQLQVAQAQTAFMNSAKMSGTGSLQATGAEAYAVAMKMQSDELIAKRANLQKQILRIE